MLISRRREGESLLIGDHVEVRVISVRGKRVILGVVAPRELKVAASKLSDAELTNTIAAAQSGNVSRLLNGRNGSAEAAILFFAHPTERAKTADKPEE